MEEVLEDLGVRDLEENIEVKQIDSWINEQIMQGIEVIRYDVISFFWKWINLKTSMCIFIRDAYYLNTV